MFYLCLILLYDAQHTYWKDGWVGRGQRKWAKGITEKNSAELSHTEHHQVTA